METPIVPVGLPAENAAAEAAALKKKVLALESELEDLNMLHETILDHGSTLENELIELVETLTKVSSDLEKGEFYPHDLDGLVNRPDELGQLGRAFRTMGAEVSARDRRLRMLRVVIPAGVALSAEKDFGRLLETIVVEAQQLCNADAGTIYLLNDAQMLQPVILRNTSLDIALGGTSGKSITDSPVPINDAQGKPNLRLARVYAATARTAVNVPDIYADQQFDFDGIKEFDAEHGYRSTSFVAIPMETESHEVVGVLQLINAKDSQSGEIVRFVPDDVLKSLLLLGTAALRSYKREEGLRQEIEQLRIQIDLVRRDKQVAEVTDSDYFRDLQRRAQELRSRR